MSLGKLFKVEVNPTPAAIAEMEDFCRVKPEGEPTLAGHYDGRGKLRRVVAIYPDGWRLQVNCRADGTVTSASAKLKLATIKVKGEAANG